MSAPDTNTLARVIYQFFHGLDARNNNAVARLMSRDGIWMRQGTALKGPDAVRKALDERDPNRRTAHVISNLYVEDSTLNTARVRFYITAFETNSDTSVAQMLGVRESIDELVLEDGEWRIAFKESRRIVPPEA